jgi:hypothetical protein
LPAWAVPVDPDRPEVVLPVVFELPELASELEFDEVLTAPDWPPLPELPE